MPIGPLIDSFATLIGALLGAALGNKLPERLRTALPQTFGVVSMAMGIVMIAKVSLLPPVILAMLLRSTAGEALKIEKGITTLAAKANGFVQRLRPTKNAVGNEEAFLKTFVSILVLFSASGTGIFGAMNEGITHNPSVLISKAFLDFFTAGIFAASLGFIVVTAVAPQAVILFALYYLGGVIIPLTTPALVADFSACGGVIMLATGFRICGIGAFSIANMLPALLVVMPLSYAWRSWF